MSDEKGAEEKWKEALERNKTEPVSFAAFPPNMTEEQKRDWIARFKAAKTGG